MYDVVEIVVAVFCSGAATGLLFGKLMNRKSYVHLSKFLESEKNVAVLESRLSSESERLHEIIHKNDELHSRVSEYERQSARLDERERQLNEIIRNREEDLVKFDEYIKMFIKDSSNMLLEKQKQKLEEFSAKDTAMISSKFENSMKEFREAICKSISNESKEVFSLKDAVLKVVDSTEKFANVLKTGGTKIHGNWGEVVLEKILEESGLRRDKDYVMHGSGMSLVHPEFNTSQRPDVIVFLPENKHVVIDSKVSLVSFENACNSSDEASRARFMKDFAHSIRNHITSLEKSRYQDSLNGSSLDFVLMFIPIEAAYFMMMQCSGELHSIAWDKRIIIVCPSTLFATLRTISQFWRIEEQKKNADRIAKIGGEIYDKIRRCIEDLAKVRKKFDEAYDAYESSCKKLFQGPGNILKKAHELEELGVRITKKIGPELTEEEDPQIEQADPADIVEDVSDTNEELPILE